MIRLGASDMGTHVVRFWPNVEDLSNNTIIQQYYSHEKQEITGSEYWGLRAQGIKAFSIRKHYSYAKVDGAYGLFSYGRSIVKMIRACMQGEYYTKDGNLYLEEELRDFKNSKRFVFEPFNVFDLKHNKAIKFDVEIMEEGYTRYINFEIVEDDSYIIYRDGDDKDYIQKFLKFHVEPIPDKIFF